MSLIKDLNSFRQMENPIIFKMFKFAMYFTNQRSQLIWIGQVENQVLLIMV